MQMDMEPVERDMLADSMDYMGNFVEPPDILVAAVIHDQTLDSAERWANYSTVGLVAVDDLDCQISDSYRSDGRCMCSTDYMRLDCNCYHAYLTDADLGDYRALDSNCHLRS